jgi:hypothetical protein
LVHNQTAQALFRPTDISDLEPRFEVERIQVGRVKGQQCGPMVGISGNEMLFGSFTTTRILCKCGADRSISRTKKKLGKMVECRHCRNYRIAREKEELDADFNGTIE